MSSVLAGPHARELRRAQRMTLDALAACTGLSKGHLSRFERGEKSLSVAAMIRIAEALGTSVGRLLGEEVAADEVRVTRARDRTMHDVGTDGASYRYTLLDGHGAEGARHEAFLLELVRGARRASTASHAGEEVLFVLNGRVALTIGDRRITLDVGDCVVFPGRIPHVLASQSDESRCLVVVVRP